MHDILKRTFSDLDMTLSNNLSKDASYPEAATRLAKHILQRFQNHDFDVCELIHAHFESAISRTFEAEQVCPLQLKHNNEAIENINRSGDAFYDYMPDKSTILEQIVPIIFGLYMKILLKKMQQKKKLIKNLKINLLLFSILMQMIKKFSANSKIMN